MNVSFAGKRIKRKVLEGLDIRNLKILKNKIRKEISMEEFESISEENCDYLSIIDDVIHQKINEDDGGGSGVAMANSGSVSGMGNVVSAQPSSSPGAVITGDGTTGSGDYGVHLGNVSSKMPSYNFKTNSKGGESKKKKSKVISDVANFLKVNKDRKFGNTDGNSKVMDFDEFTKSGLNDIKK